MRVIAGLVLLLALSACSDEPAVDGPDLEAEPSAPVTPQPEEPDDEPAEEPDACDEVRAGIDAFNRGDFEETVERFEVAVPLAEAAAEESPSRLADDLLEAVEYYAELAPEDYPEASLRSPDFLKYKQITLSQCAGEGQIGPPEEPGVDI